MYMSDLWQRGEEKGTFAFAKQPASLLTNEPAINQPTNQRTYQFTNHRIQRPCSPLHLNQRSKQPSSEPSNQRTN